jgi:DNA-binding SARP family transcriptional activator
VALRWASQLDHAAPGHRSYRGSVEVRLFGEFEVVREGVAIPVRGAKQRALLALLALNRGNPVSADRLIDQLWGDGQTAKPANALQAQIVQLRRTLGASAIVTSESGYALDISAADLDAARFEDLVAEGRRGDVSCTLGTVMAGSL